MDGIRDDKGRYLPGHAKTSPGCPATARQLRDEWREIMCDPEHDRIRKFIRMCFVRAMRGHPVAMQLICKYTFGEPVELDSGPNSQPPIIIQVVRENGNGQHQQVKGDADGKPTGMPA